MRWQILKAGDPVAQSPASLGELIRTDQRQAAELLKMATAGEAQGIRISRDLFALLRGPLEECPTSRRVYREKIVPGSLLGIVACGSGA